jgi:mRNA-degrading endonuclease RelE of RelBE toxin-antitoxin system
MEKLITVAEVDPFDATARRARLTEAERKDLTDFLAANPEAGELIKETGGLRKARWATNDAGKHGGKSGGYRVIYYFFNEEFPIYMLSIYPKNQQVDLTPEQKKRLTKLAGELKAAAKAVVKKRSVR